MLFRVWLLTGLVAWGAVVRVRHECGRAKSNSRYKKTADCVRDCYGYCVDGVSGSTAAANACVAQMPQTCVLQFGVEVLLGPKMVLVGDAAVRLVFPASIQYGLPETGVRTLRNSQLHLNVPGQDQCSGLYELCHLDWPSEVPGNLTIADDIASCGRPYQATQVDADGITLDISHAMGVHPDFGNEVVDLTLVAGDKDVYGTPACPMTDTGADGAYVLFTQTIRTLGKAT